MFESSSHVTLSWVMVPSLDSTLALKVCSPSSNSNGQRNVDPGSESRAPSTAQAISSAVKSSPSSVALPIVAELAPRTISVRSNACVVA